MKLKMKISGRERWVLTFAPTILILGVYLLLIEGGLADALAKEQHRAVVAQAVLAKPPPTGPSPALLKAKTDLADKSRQITEQSASIDRLHQQIDALTTQVAVKRNDRHAAAAIEQIQAIFAQNRITPARSEPADPQHEPQELVSVLAPKDTSAGGAPSEPRVWHLVIDGQLIQFQKALDQLTREAPTVVPLSLNIVYNPDDNGDSRLLELWLLY
jgi:hypothetical protein